MEHISFFDWCLINNKKSMLDEWDNEKNGSITPQTISFGSTKQIYWKCEQGHCWNSSPNNRTGKNATGCPFCTNRKVLKGYNDLKTKFPEIAEEWNFEKNNTMKPDEIVYGSNKIVWWKCQYNHEWKAAICQRIYEKTKCPYCSGKKILCGFNDFATQNPNLIQEWDKKQNIGIDPTKISSSYKGKVWWNCPNGHSYYTSVVSRAKQGTGCPYCTHQKPIVGENDLSTLFPLLSKEFDQEKNKVELTSLMPYSNIKVWWKCEKGHSYSAMVCDRTAGKGCPICAGRKVLIGYNDLFTTNPELKQTWDYEKNIKKPTELTKGSSYKAWWICDKDHSWQATVSSRACNKNGCPFCGKGYQTSLAEKIIGFYLAQKFQDLKCNVKLPFLNGMELDIFIPSMKTAIEYDGDNWHKDIEKDKKKDDCCFQHGIKLIRVREPDCPQYESSSEKIIAKNPDNRMLYMAPVVEKICEKITGINGIIDIDIKRDYPTILNSIFYKDAKDSLAEQFSKAQEEWNYEKNGKLTPFMLKPNSNKKVWWKCSKCGYEWQAVVQSRFGNGRNGGCPKCAGQVCIVGVNDLLTLKPQIAAEFDVEKNKISADQIFAQSNKKYWWKCKQGHSFLDSPTARKATSKCPICQNQKILIGYNDLATTFPALAEEWDFEKNDLRPTDVTKGSDKKVWWKCEKGHSWQAYIYTRTSKNPSGCPICNRHKRISE